MSSSASKVFDSQNVADQSNVVKTFTRRTRSSSSSDSSLSEEGLRGRVTKRSASFERSAVVTPPVVSPSVRTRAAKSSSASLIASTTVKSRKACRQQERSSTAGTSLQQMEFQQPHTSQCHRAPLQQKGSDCKPVLLINSDVDETLVVRPESKGNAYTTKGISTLELLRNGLLSYEKKKTSGDETEYLEAYCCKLPKRRTYYLYKTVVVVNPISERETIRGFQNTLDLIRLYVGCFAVLADFIFDYSLTTPVPNDHLPNVLVVDKVWKYDHGKRAYIPTYMVLNGDSYTHYVLQRVKQVFKCETIVFVSTAHTSLFANQSMLNLTVDADSTATQTTTGPVSAASSSSERTPSRGTSHRPLKKRKEVLMSCQELPPVKKKRVTFADEKRPASREPEAQPRDTQVISNPTLIIFRPNFINKKSTLVCPICIEVHLGKGVNYN